MSSQCFNVLFFGFGFGLFFSIKTHGTETTDEACALEQRFEPQAHRAMNDRNSAGAVSGGAPIAVGY
uniref:Putative secreted protein n=1 Tax=Anopheles darlingi TaxID=43151 RepID=A0A2M4DPC9_ANODA